MWWEHRSPKPEYVIRYLETVIALLRASLYENPENPRTEGETFRIIFNWHTAEHFHRPEALAGIRHIESIVANTKDDIARVRLEDKRNGN